MIKKEALLKIVMGAAFLLFSGMGWAQYSISGKVTDFDSHKPISCVRVHIESSDWEIDTIVKTNGDGFFILEGLTEDTYDVTFNENNHKSLTKNVDLEDGSAELDVALYDYDSESYKIEDIADEDEFDVIMGFGLYSPPMQESDAKFRSLFSFDYAYEYKMKLANRLQLGFRYVPLKVKWMVMNSDTSIVNITHGKERYFEASTGFGIYARYIFTTTGHIGNRGMFLDMGGSYSLPYYFSYSYFTEDHLKTSRNKIRKFNDFQAMLRLGFYWGSVNATYRFTDIMKDNYIEPPRFILGVEFNIPAGD